MVEFLPRHLTLAFEFDAITDVRVLLYDQIGVPQAP
jgi:hypothetical protein